MPGTPVRIASIHAADTSAQPAALVPAWPRFRLATTAAVALASGWVALAPARSPFAVDVTRDGRIIYDLDVTVHGLPPASSLGSYAIYEAWLATPNLDLVRRLGPIRNDVPIRGRVDWNKFMVFVSAEATPATTKWSSAIVLVGRSPSSLMRSFAGHPFYNNGLPPF